MPVSNILLVRRAWKSKSNRREIRTEKSHNDDVYPHAIERTIRWHGSARHQTYSTVAWNHHRATNIRCNGGVRHHATIMPQTVAWNWWHDESTSSVVKSPTNDLFYTSEINVPLMEKEVQRGQKKRQRRHHTCLAIHRRPCPWQLRHLSPAPTHELQVSALVIVLHFGRWWRVRSHALITWILTGCVPPRPPHKQSWKKKWHVWAADPVWGNL
jgi:hypothetical protein